MVVGSNAETDPIARPQHECSLDRSLPSVDLLIHPWRIKPDASVFSSNHQGTVFQFELLPPAELEFRLCWIRSRSHLEVILQMSLVSVKDQIDAGINVLVTHPSKLGHSHPPTRRIVTDEIVTFPRKRISGTQARIGTAPRQLHPQNLDPALRTRGSWPSFGDQT